jgi:L-ascorbate oxidase
VNGKLYDFDLAENYMILMEWKNITLQLNYGPYLHAALFPSTHTILVNGKGTWPERPDLSIPLQTYTVKRGFRYRFRLINNVLEYCPLQISIEGHNLTIISSDIDPFQPIEVESLVSEPGERYDFVINANAPVDKDYWIKIKGEGGCFRKISQRAILRYERDDWELDQYFSNISLTFDELSSTGLVIYFYF